MSRSRAASVASSSSLEIIDDEDVMSDLQEMSSSQIQEMGSSQTADSEWASPDQSIVQELVNSVQGISKSQINTEQVVFMDVKDSYSFPFTVRVSSKGDELGCNDIIAIFKTPFLDVQDSLAASNVITTNETSGQANFISCSLTENEFYQFQYLRREASVTGETIGDTVHKVCGASVPWQYHQSATSASNFPGDHGYVNRQKAWDMKDEKKFNEISSRLWQDENTSKLVEMCLAEQIKEFFYEYEGIELSFLTTILSPNKLPSTSFSVKNKSCNMYRRLGRILNLLANMKAKDGKLLKELLVVAVKLAKEDRGLGLVFCSVKGELMCKCPIFDYILHQPLQPLQPLQSSTDSEKTMERSRESESSYCSLTSMRSMEDEVKSLQQENGELKKQVESRDSSILVLEAEKNLAANLLETGREQMSNDIKCQVSKYQLEKEKLLGELNLVKNSLDESIKEKSRLYTKLDGELDQRQHLLANIRNLEAKAEQLRSEKAAVMKHNMQLKQELEEVNKMLEAAQLSKEAAAMISRDQSAVSAQKVDQSAVSVQTNDQSGDSLSWVRCEDATSLRSVRDDVDGDLVKAFSSLGVQLEAANNKIKELEELLRKEKEKTEAANENKVEESCPLQSSQETVSLASTEEIVQKVEEKMSDRIKMLEAQSQQSMKDLATRTQELEDVQKELRKYMKENVELMSQRLNTLQQDNKANEVKIQKLESCASSDTWSERGSIESSRASLASSCNSNMNSIKIASELSGAGAFKNPSLPTPLVPERLETDPGIPELRKRAPSKYSMSNVETWINQEDGTCMFCHEFVSDGEAHVCGKETEASKAHKMQKALLEKKVPFCPICFKVFQQEGDRKKLTSHVQSHFENDDESFLDLGID